MTKYKTIEFWLVLLPLLMVFSIVVAGFDQVTGATGPITLMAGAWLALAIFWMIREFVRRIAS